MKFQEYYNQTIINEGKAKPHKYAMKIEEYIVDAINGKKFSVRDKRFEEVANEIVNHFNLSGNAIHTGKGYAGELNEEYLTIMKNMGRQTQINKTPKTDFVINGERLSLKMNKGWLFAHQLYDSQACLEYTLNRNKELSEELKLELINFIEGLRKREGSMTTDKSLGYGVYVDETIKNFVSIIKENENNLMIDFIKNGLTGEFKFKPENYAVAEKLMVIKFNKSVNTYEAIQNPEYINLEKSFIADIKQDNDYIKSLASKARVSFIINYENQKLRMDINEAEFFDKIISMLKVGYDKVKIEIKRWFDYLIEQLRKGVGYFLKAVGIQVRVQLQDEIEF